LRRIRVKKIVVGVAIAALALVPASVAGAKDGDIIREGSCTGSSDWKLKLSPENGRIEVEYEVDQNVNGHDWRVTLKLNGERFFRGIRTTQPPSGSFEVNRRIDNGAGEELVTARARNLTTDEVCKGAAVWK
jgi:hypothetical protein